MARGFKLSGSLSIIIPAFNEEGNLANLIKETLRDARRISQNFDIIIINDGSSDNTPAIADSLAKANREVKAVHHKRNRGLALAWRTGINSSKKELILYIEGDGQQPFKDQFDLLKKIKHADLVLGTRSERYDYSPFRKIFSYGYLFLIWLLFDLRYKDVGWSQAYRRKIFKKIQMKSITPFFDTEVIIKAKRYGFKIAEARSYYRRRKAGVTTLGNLKTASSMFIEMIKMKLGLLD